MSDARPAKEQSTPHLWSVWHHNKSRKNVKVCWLSRDETWLAIEYLDSKASRTLATDKFFATHTSGMLPL
jgi:hypothetical protein